MNRSMSRIKVKCMALLTAVCLSITPALAQNSLSYSDPVLLKQSDVQFSNPTDLALSPEGGYLLVADSSNNEVKIMQPGTLKVLSQFGKDHFEGPRNIYFAKNGELKVIDRNQSRQSSYTFKGVFRDGSANIKKLGEQTVTSASLQNPGYARDLNGQRYQIDTGTNQVEISDKDNNLINLYGAEVLNEPRAVETVGRYFWIADTGNNRILLLKAPRPKEQ